MRVLLGLCGPFSWDCVALSPGIVWTFLLGFCGSFSWDCVGLSPGIVWTFLLGLCGPFSWDCVGLSPGIMWAFLLGLCGPFSWDCVGLLPRWVLTTLCFHMLDGVGRGAQASSVVQMLVNKGADCRLRCHWTDMNSLHYAAFFNVESAVDTLLNVAPGEDFCYRS